MINEWIPVEVRKTPDKLGEYLVEYNNESLVWHKVLTWFPEDFGPYKAGWHDLNDLLDASINHEEDMVAWMPIIWYSEEGDEDEG